jgi:sugar phosphate isomerase/epimerase
MKLATTTCDFKRYLDNDCDRIQELYNAGFRYIDLDMGFDENSPYMQDNWKEEADKIKVLAKKLKMEFVQAHAPGHINPLDKNAERVDLLVKLTNRSIELCEYLGIKNTVVHNGEDQNLTKEEWEKANKDFYLRILPTAEKCGVNILCENSAKCNIQGHFVNTAKDMLDFIKFVDHKNVHACWDIGHGNAEGVDQYEQITTLGKELYAIHYHDNFGRWDEHHAPFIGIVNHDQILCALRDADYKGYFTFESCLMFFRSRRPFDKYESKLTPQIFMQRKIEELIYQTGVYMLKQYEMFEE